MKSLSEIKDLADRLRQAGTHDIWYEGDSDDDDSLDEVVSQTISDIHEAVTILDKLTAYYTMAYERIPGKEPEGPSAIELISHIKQLDEQLKEGDWRKGVLPVGQRYAHEDEIKAANEEYREEGLMVDNNAAVSIGDDGHLWVSGWLRIPQPEADEIASLGTLEGAPNEILDEISDVIELSGDILERMTPFSIMHDLINRFIAHELNGDYWAEHPNASFAEWRQDVDDGSTRKGYHEWAIQTTGYAEL